MRASRGGEKRLAWVKGHSAVMGNELSDLRAKKGVWEGVRQGKENMATAGGIRPEFRVTRRAKEVHDWDRDALRTYLHLYR